MVSFSFFKGERESALWVVFTKFLFKHVHALHKFLSIYSLILEIIPKDYQVLLRTSEVAWESSWSILSNIGYFCVKFASRLLKLPFFVSFLLISTLCLNLLVLLHLPTPRFPCSSQRHVHFPLNLQYHTGIMPKDCLVLFHLLTVQKSLPVSAH